MTIGKITIESGDCKATFEFVNEKVTINFDPSVEIDNPEKTEEQIFVENAVGFITNYLIGNDE